MLITELHRNNQLHNEQYCFPQIHIWPHTKNMQKKKKVWPLALQPAAFWTSTPQFYFLRQSHSPDKQEAGLIFSSIVCDFIHSHATKTMSEWCLFLFFSSWISASSEPDLHMQGHAGPEPEEGVVERGLNARRSRKKASQQNYKPEKISIPRHWEQNGFCFPLG